MQPFTIDVLGRWSYAFCVSLYVLLLIRLVWYFRCTFRFTVRRVAVTMAVFSLLILGFAFELRDDGHDVPGVDVLVYPFPRGGRDQGSLAGAIQRGVTQSGVSNAVPLW
jgi:hypothetical protein